jgi:nitric oxide reductase NorD protein
MRTTLSQWLRLLWPVAPPLRLDGHHGDRPYITGGAIHLPARAHWSEHAAAAAHAAAHLVYSPRVFDGTGLGPVARALMGVLEDARVEALAMRELPGLARLWRPLHTATPAHGADFEALLQRLARALIDPAYQDSDSWVRKGRALFYRDDGALLPALRTAAEVRRAATRLGHDIGQMRLQFNAKAYRPALAYRDDHRWMWAAETLHEAPPPAPVATDHAPQPPTREYQAPVSVSRYAEWDRLIACMRPEWCRVIEQQLSPDVPSSAATDDTLQRLALRLHGPLQALARRPGTPRRNDEGEHFDPAALVDWSVARHLRVAADTHVYRGETTCAGTAAVYVLIDQSASTAATHGAIGHSVLQSATAAAAAVATVLQTMGVACAIAGFSSDGRHAAGRGAAARHPLPCASA